MIFTGSLLLKEPISDAHVSELALAIATAKQMSQIGSDVARNSKQQRAPGPPFAATCLQSLLDPFASFSSIDTFFTPLNLDHKLEVTKNAPKRIRPSAPAPANMANPVATAAADPDLVSDFSLHPAHEARNISSILNSFPIIMGE